MPHAEYGPAGMPVVTPLACSLDRKTIVVDLVAGSVMAWLHRGAAQVTERTTCTYGLLPDLHWIAQAAGMQVSARDGTGEVRAVERPGHPFFVASLYQPQLSSAPEAPHPVFLGFLDALLRQSLW